MTLDVRIGMICLPRGNPFANAGMLRWRALLWTLTAIGSGFTAFVARGAAAPTFWSEVDRSMGAMMSRMHVKPSGDVDRDFVAMMVPHHQGGIDMAVAELRFGRDERLKRMAREIVVEQQAEIAAMRAAADSITPSRSSPPIGPSKQAHAEHQHD